MKRNILKIVYDPLNNRVSYYFKNEIGQWCPLSNSSILSRQAYTKTTIKDSADEIIKIADEIYNRKNKGLDILFEGRDEDFNVIKKIVEQKYAENNINCILNSTKIIVVGKKESGKTTLIESIAENAGRKYKVKKRDEYTLYMDQYNNSEWYEIRGIDIGRDNMDKAHKTIRDLMTRGITTIVYCIKSSTGGRLEVAEKKFITSLLREFSELDAVISLNFCIKKDQRVFIDEIERMTDQIRVVQTLAKEYETVIEDENGDDRPIKISPYGLDILSKYIFERR